jgi:hypothetical protein
MTPESIFDYLTIQNPDIAGLSAGRGNTSNQAFWRPKKLQEWTDFNMKVIRELFGGELMREASKTRPAFHVPRINEIQREVHDEATTWHLLEHWTVFTTMEALEAVRHTLHPATWKVSERKRAKPKGDKKRRSRVDTDHKTKRTDYAKLRVDVSTVPLCNVCRFSDRHQGAEQRMPKEIKVYPKFLASRTLENLQDGFWDDENRNTDDEMPIRQAYTYCVTSGCRYGCILTAHEAFIFRISPLNPSHGPFRDPKERFEGEIKKAMRNNGLMEFKVIPWNSHMVGEPEKFQELTVNFALWVLHVLAGNAYRLDWSYQPLVKETLVQGPCPVVDLSAKATDSKGKSQGNEATPPQLSASFGDMTPPRAPGSPSFQNPFLSFQAEEQPDVVVGDSMIVALP